MFDKSFINLVPSDLNFESTEREAAILTMPEGALTQNLLNSQVIRKCIAKNARSWFEYARDTRGRIVENGDIRVVVGWDKVCSWGIATSKSTSGQSVSLAFKVDDKAGSSRVYCWECIGSGGGRVGPHEDEIADLRQKGEGVPQNQCVFVRTMDFSLAGDIGDDFSATAVHLPVSDKTKGSKAQQSSGTKVSSRSQSSSLKGGSHDRESVKFDTTERGVRCSVIPSLLVKFYFSDCSPDGNASQTFAGKSMQLSQTSYFFLGKTSHHDCITVSERYNGYNPGCRLDIGFD